MQSDPIPNKTPVAQIVGDLAFWPNDLAVRRIMLAVPPAEQKAVCRFVEMQLEPTLQM